MLAQNDKPWNAKDAKELQRAKRLKEMLKRNWMPTVGLDHRSGQNALESKSVAKRSFWSDCTNPPGADLRVSPVGARRRDAPSTNPPGVDLRVSPVGARRRDAPSTNPPGVDLRVSPVGARRRDAPSKSYALRASLLHSSRKRRAEQKLRASRFAFALQPRHWSELWSGGLESKSVAKRSFWSEDPNLPLKICAQGKSYALRATLLHSSPEDALAHFRRNLGVLCAFFASFALPGFSAP